MAYSQIEAIKTIEQSPGDLGKDIPAVPYAMDTKLQPPLIANKRLTRADLLARLTGFQTPGALITVIAPAGSGKSTLVTELHESLASPDHFGCWLSLDAEDDDPAIFARHITMALYQLNESFAEKELAFLKANPARDFDGFFDSLITLITSSTHKVTLFVDDFQYLSNPTILRFWNRLIAHTPASMRIVLTSRVKLPLELGRKRMAGTLLEIDHHDLNLTPEQLYRFMQELHAIDLPCEAATLLHDTTEGWIAGLHLAALAISKDKEQVNDVIQRFSTQDQDLKEYLFQSVLKVQSPEVRDFLLHTAPLPKMSANLCDAVTQRKDSADMLERIQESNLFLIPLDRDRQWFRYHHLFAEFLQNELQRSDMPGFRQVCERAAEWCESEGYLTEAIQYCLDGGDFDKAADLIAEHAPDVALYRGDHATILDWMRRLPEKYHYKRPEILLNHAWSLAFSREQDKAVTITDEIIDILKNEDQKRWDISAEESTSLQWYAKVTKLIAKVACTDETKRGAEMSQALIEELPDNEPVLIASVYNTKGYCHFAQKNITRCAHAGTEAYLYAQEGASIYSVVWGDFLNGMAHIELGRIRAADEYAQRAKQNAGPRTSNNSFICGLAALINAEVEVQRCNFDTVDHHLNNGKVFSSIFGPLEAMLIALRSEARLLAWKGALGEARKVLNQGQATALSTHQPRLYFALAAEEVDLQLRFDDVESALDTIRRTNLLDSDHPFINADNKAGITELARLTEAKIYIAQGNSHEALKLLSLIYKSAQNNQRTTLTQHIRALKSIALWNSGREKEAVRELDRALTVAAPEAHIYPLISAGAGILEILENIQEKRTSAFVDENHQIKHAFEKKLIALLKGEAPDAQVAGTKSGETQELAEPLTDREVEILKLIAAGLGNKQLADELLISISTVKWHLHNVYEKIGVRSRTAAAAVARNMNLI